MHSAKARCFAEFCTSQSRTLPAHATSILVLSIPFALCLDVRVVKKLLRCRSLVLHLVSCWRTRLLDPHLRSALVAGRWDGGQYEAILRSPWKCCNGTGPNRWSCLHRRDPATNLLAAGSHVVHGASFCLQEWVLNMPYPSFLNSTVKLIVSPLWIASLYISTKLSMRSIYEGGPVPELVTHVTGVKQDFVQLSSLDMLLKSCTPDCTQCCWMPVIIVFADLVLSLLTMHICWRAWRFPDEAVSLQSGFPVSELYLARAGGVMRPAMS